MMELSFMIGVIIIMATALGFLLGSRCSSEKKVLNKEKTEDAVKKLNKEKIQKEMLQKQVQMLEKKLDKFTQTNQVGAVRADELTIDAIKARLREVSLSTAGNKFELAERLTNHQPHFWR